MTEQDAAGPGWLAPPAASWTASAAAVGTWPSGSTAAAACSSASATVRAALAASWRALAAFAGCLLGFAGLPEHAAQCGALGYDRHGGRVLVSSRLLAQAGELGAAEQRRGDLAVDEPGWVHLGGVPQFGLGLVGLQEHVGQQVLRVGVPLAEVLRELGGPGGPSSRRTARRSAARWASTPSWSMPVTRSARSANVGPARSMPATRTRLLGPGSRNVDQRWVTLPSSTIAAATHTTRSRSGLVPVVLGIEDHVAGHSHLGSASLAARNASPTVGDESAVAGQRHCRDAGPQMTLQPHSWRPRSVRMAVMNSSRKRVIARVRAASVKRLAAASLTDLGAMI